MRPEGRDEPTDEATLMSYVKVYGFMGSVLGLSGLELNVFARIFGFTACGRFFYESRAKTAAFFGSSRRAVITAVGKLEARGLIIEEPSDEDARTGNTKAYVVNLELVAQALGIEADDLKTAGFNHGEETSPQRIDASEESSLPNSEEPSLDQVKNLHPIPKRKPKWR